MNSNPLFYSERSPSADVSHLVWSFWEFRVSENGTGPMHHEVFPDGCISIFFYGNKKFNYSGIGCSALTLETFVSEVQPGNFYWGMRIAPAACARIFRVDPATLENTGAFEFSPVTAGLVEKLRECADFDDGMKVLEEKMRALAIAPEALDEKVVTAVSLIEASRGEAKVAEIAAGAGLSTRQLQRSFRKNTGLTPKQFIRVRRIRAAAVNLVENNESNWAKRAAETGFADQAHLNHEFVSLTGRSPNSFADKVKDIEHGDLL